MTATTTRPAMSDASVLRLEVEEFYARQMQLLDEGEVAAWAATFADEGSFATNTGRAAVVGRSAIEAGAREATDALAREGVVRRHWLGMLAVRPRPDGSVDARSYALVISTPRGGQAAVHVSTVCEDHLVRDDDGTLLVRERHVTRDDLVGGA